MRRSGNHTGAIKSAIEREKDTILGINAYAIRRNARPTITNVHGWSRIPSLPFRYSAKLSVVWRNGSIG
jgi:hypothetical protein